MTQRGIQKDISKQLFEALDRIEKLENKLNEAYTTIKEMKKDFSKKEKQYSKKISILEKENKNLKQVIDKKDNEIKNLKGEILRLRTNNKKDSTNSSKPSSTDGYKKAVTNRRAKSQIKNQVNQKEAKVQIYQKRN